MASRARFTRIGNSFGIRIPRPLIEQSGLGEEVEIEVERYQILIRKPRHPREGWRPAFSAMAERGDDAPVGFADSSGSTAAGAGR